MGRIRIALLLQLMVVLASCGPPPGESEQTPRAAASDHRGSGAHSSPVARFTLDRREVGRHGTWQKTASAKKLRSLVLFRTHTVDWMTLSVGRAIGESVAESEYDLAVLYDPDALDRETALSFQDAVGNGTRLIGVGLAAMTSRYPTLPRKNIAKSHFQQLAYATAYSEMKEEYSYVWCVEHDVALTGGNWRGMFADHDDHDSRDLLAWRVGWVPRVDPVHGGGSWNANMLYGPKFQPVLRRKPDVAFLFGPIVRFSARFLVLLDDDARDGNYGHSEIAVPTLCNETDWCSMGNLSSRWVGLNEYQLPLDIGPFAFDHLQSLAPSRLFHPVRQSGSASNRQYFDKTQQLSSGQKAAAFIHRPLASVAEAKRAQYVALCLVANPRPPRPSMSCPVGCPHHLQTACPTVDCVWGAASEDVRYKHLAAADCVSKCLRHPEGCPYLTS